MNISLKTYFNNRYFLLASAAIVSLLIEPFGFTFLLLLPFFFVFRIDRSNILLSLPIVLSLNILATILNASILDNLNLPVTLASIVTLTALEATALQRLNFDKINLDIPKSSYKYFYIIYILFVLAIISRVISVIHLHAPILHDPQAHAFWANKIANEQAIDYFYSPGLHVWSWTVNETLGISVARSVHIVTNTFSALSVLAWALAAFIFTKNGRVAMWIGLILLVVPIPQSLYFMAGKNAFVASVPFIALTTIFSLHFLKKRSWLSFGLLLVCLVGVGLIHYPAYAFIASSVLLYYILIFIADNFKDIKKQLFKHAGKLFFLGLPVLISAVLITGNVLSTQSEDSSVNLVSSRSEAKIFHKTAESLDNETLQYQKSAPTTSAPKEFNNPFAEAKSITAEYVAFSKSLPRDTGIIMLGAAAVSFYFLLTSRFSSQKLKHYRMVLISLLLSVFLLSYSLSIYPIKSLSTTRDTGFLLLPILSALPIGWLLAHVSKRRIIEGIVIVSIAVASSYLTFTSYREGSGRAYINNYDIEAFEWIDENIDDSQKFVSTSSPDPRRASVIFPTDGALWLPVFTDNSISTPFHELGFLAVNSHVNHEYAKRLGARKRSVVSNAVQYFTNNGYRFIYVDGTAAHKELGIEYLLKNGFARKVYNNQSVSVVRLTQ